MNIKGYIHSTESFGSVDGPGIRFLIFMQGCHMRCRYCHNPDTWALGCTRSEEQGARGEVQEVSVGELLDKAERYRTYWGPDGGITVSGGEALLQMDFLTELFAEAKRRGIGTCLDTAAQPFTSRQPFFAQFERLMQHTDTVLLDIKHIDDAEHRRLTGHSNQNILDCARYLSDIGKPVWVRHVLVPEWTDRDEWLQALRRFLDTLTNIERVEVLPYHTLGVFKWENLGIPYSLKGIASPSVERVDNARRILGAV